MDDITDELSAYAQVCELSSGVKDLLRAARADIIDLRQRFAVVEEKYFSVLKHWNETCAELAAADATIERMSKGVILQDALKERDTLSAELAARDELLREARVWIGGDIGKRIDAALAKGGGDE